MSPTLGFPSGEPDECSVTYPSDVAVKQSAGLRNRTRARTSGDSVVPVVPSKVFPLST